MASVVGIPSFYSTNQHELFFVLEDQPTQSPKKRKKVSVLMKILQS